MRHGRPPLFSAVSILALLTLGTTSGLPPADPIAGGSPAEAHRPLGACQDADDDGVSTCEGDCDDANPFCTTDCTDADGDGTCVTFDCNDADFNCDSDCTDADGDGFCLPYDCNDAVVQTLDGDGDAVPDLCDNCPATPNRDQIDIDTFGPPIQEDSDDAADVSAGDLDGDGDLDILAALEDRVSWYEHLDGNGNFGAEINLTGFVLSPGSVIAADVDGDDDLDVVYGAEIELAWLENVNGDATSWSFHPIELGVQGWSSVVAADVDGDDDLDLVTAATDLNAIKWYDNTDGDGFFSFGQTLANAGTPRAVFVTDLDGGDDPDILSASSGSDTVAWYANTGGVFGAPIVISNTADGARSVFAADIDGDGDPDVVSAATDDDDIDWYENQDGGGSFGPPQEVDGNASGVVSIFVADLDLDGHRDIVAALSSADTIAWYRNEMSPNATNVAGQCASLQPSRTQLPFGATSKQSACPPVHHRSPQHEVHRSTSSNSQPRFL